MGLRRLYGLAEATIKVPDGEVPALRKLLRLASSKGMLPQGAERWLNHDYDIERSMLSWERPPATEPGSLDTTIPKAASVRVPRGPTRRSRTAGMGND